MDSNPYAPPVAVVADIPADRMAGMLEFADLEYAGFWLRVWASVIDSVLTMLLTVPLIYAAYGTAYWSAGKRILHGPLDFLISWVLPAVAVLLFWVAKQATPGKMAISARIVDANTGEKVTTGRLIIRYLGYFIAMVPLFLGIFWVAFDRRKQGWHDKLAGTVVVRRRGGTSEPVRFDNAE